MEEEDWGKSAQAPPFCLFNYVSPEEAFKRGGFVDPIVYAGWKKAERRLYMKLKSEQIITQIKQEKITSEDDIVRHMEALTLMKSKSQDEELDELMQVFGDLKLRVANNKAKMKK